VAARKAGANEEALVPALNLQRRAQWRLDYIAAENSMGFHAPQEAARVLGEAADYARQGQLAALHARAPELVPKPAMPEPGPVGSAAAPATSGLPAPSAH